MKLSIKEILEITNGELVSGNENDIVSHYSKDTRTINKGDCYVGLKGEKYDGNTFYKDALEKGASTVILDNESIIDTKDGNIILVNDSLSAIQSIASFVRDRLDVPVIAITGSAGKTSTKDFIASVLSTKYKVLKTPGNLNGQVGLPFNILEYNGEDVIVLEMGMNDFGQISKLTNIAKPNYAVITNIGTAHIGILGSKEGILKAKLEILEGLDKDGILLFNGDDELLSKSNAWPNTYTYSINNNSNIKASNIKYKDGNTMFNIDNEEYIIPVLGNVFVYNAMAGIGIGKLFNLSYKDIYNGLKNCGLSSNRMAIINTSKYTLLNDTYNANLEAVKSAIDTLSTFDRRKVAILGDMLELGDYSKDIHKEAGEYLNKKADILIAIGEYSKNTYDSFNGEKYYYKDVEESKNNINNIIKDQDVILLKASHGMNFSELVTFLNN